MTRSIPDWKALRGGISGEVVLPASPAYEAARKPAIANFHDVCPQAVVLCETPEDVSETILFARRHGLRAAPRSGGHCFAGRSSTGGIVIDVSPMRSVYVSGGVATVGAGARLGAVYGALNEHGLTIPAGCGPSVGISGLTLGGGIGILGRKHGLTSDGLLGARVVLADGRIVECDEHRHEDLFWALRGAGGGNFGVVTSLDFRTVPAPASTAFHLTWPQERAAAVIGAWQHWAPAALDEMAASLLVVAPADPDQTAVVNLFGAMIGPESDVEDLLEGLVVCAGADPTSSLLKHMPYREVKGYLAELGDAMSEGDDGRVGGHSDSEPAQGHALSKSEFFRRPLPKETVTALVENFEDGRVPGKSRELDFTPWGGAYNRVPAETTAFAHRGELFALQHAVVVDPDASTSRAPVGLGGRLPELPRPRSRRLGACIPRGQPRPPGARQGEIRPRQLLPLPPIDPGPRPGRRPTEVMAPQRIGEREETNGR